LIDITRDLTSTLDLSILLNRIVVIAADLCDAEAASILLYDETNRQLYFEAASNLGMPALRGLIVPVDSSLAGWIVTNRQPVIISDTQKDPRHFGQIAKATGVLTTSLLGVPLFVKDRVIGALEAINKQAGQFDEDDMQILNALGAQAAVAIENARLFQQSDLVSEMVHELRTPLSSLNAAAHLMLKEGLTDEQRVKLVHTMQRETQRLTELQDNFKVELARLKSPQRITKIAREKLGLTMPAPRQMMVLP
jgi:GAF domain-containing protein